MEQKKETVAFEDLHPHVQSRLLEITELVNRMPLADDEARNKLVAFLGKKYFTQDPAEAWKEDEGDDEGDEDAPVDDPNSGSI